MADSTPHTPGGDQLDRALLAAFIPLLRETVIPSTIIAHLMALLPLDEVDKILADERSSGPAVAMQRLWGYCRSVDSPAGYEHIRDIIKGRQTACDMAFFRRLLAVCAPNLQRIVAVDMLPHLCCLTDDDKVLVRNEARNHGNSRAVVTLLDRVTRREPGWFQQFVSGLRQTGFDDIAEQLEDLSSVPEEVYSPEEPFAEVSGVVTGEAAVPTGDGGGYQSCPEPGFPEETAPRSPEKSAPEPSSPEDTAPWKVALSQLGSQLISMSGRMGVTVGQQVCMFGRTIHYSTRGAFSHGLQWRFYGEARDQESGRTFKDAEGYCAQSSAVRMAAMGVLKILMTEGIIESREMKDEDFDNLD
ncbi:Interferon induced with helicase C domain 1 [Branchiostoma belcheri]|nr:Interferon induced with helicase C domain 1 [Branchiostoma belcheri]